MTEINYAWRGAFGNDEFHILHAEAFETKIWDDDWVTITARHSLGWVVARDTSGALVGFVNVIWDGLVHAWIQDVMVAKSARGHGIATELVRLAADQARAVKCEFLHVDFDDDLKP